MNSYQRLKQKHEQDVERLTNDIKALVSDPDGMPYKIAREKWKFIFQMEDALWNGNSVDGTFDGFMQLLQNGHK